MGSGKRIRSSLTRHVTNGKEKQFLVESLQSLQSWSRFLVDTQSIENVVSIGSFYIFLIHYSKETQKKLFCETNCKTASTLSEKPNSHRRQSRNYFQRSRSLAKGGLTSRPANVESRPYPYWKSTRICDASSIRVGLFVNLRYTKRRENAQVCELYIAIAFFSHSPPLLVGGFQRIPRSPFFLRICYAFSIAARLNLITYPIYI